MSLRSARRSHLGAGARTTTLVAVLLFAPSCAKKSPEQAAEEAAGATAQPSATARVMPSVWRYAPASPSASAGANAAERRKNMLEMKEALLEKQDGGTLSEREKAMLGLLCKNLGDPSCTPAEKKKGEPHKH